LWRLAAKSVFLLVGIVLAAVGLVFLGVALAFGLEEQAFHAEGQTVEATVVDRAVRKANFDDTPSTRYVIRYRFVRQDGAPVYDTRDVPVEEWERLVPGSRTPVRVVHGRDSRAVGDSRWDAVAAFSALGLIMAGVGGPLLFLGLREALRQRRVWRAGVRVAAVVTSVAPSSTWVNGVQQWEIRYAYTDANGVKHEARSDHMPQAQARRWKAGDHGFALVDPQASASSVWAGAQDAAA
jgi:hypothetical protein